MIGFRRKVRKMADDILPVRKVCDSSFNLEIAMGGTCWPKEDR